MTPAQYNEYQRQADVIDEAKRWEEEKKLKLTSIEWLAKELESHGDPQYCELEWKTLDLLLEQAKEMHKQEIIDAYDEGELSVVKNAEQYYQETFKKD